MEIPESTTDDVVDDDVQLFSDDDRQAGFGPRGVPTFGATISSGRVSVSLVRETDDFQQRQGESEAGGGGVQ